MNYEHYLTNENPIIHKQYYALVINYIRPTGQFKVGMPIILIVIPLVDSVRQMIMRRQ